MELFLHHLALTLEADRATFTAQGFSAWLDVCRDAMTRHNSVPATHIAALAHLQRRVLS